MIQPGSIRSIKNIYRRIYLVFLSLSIIFVFLIIYFQKNIFKPNKIIPLEGWTYSPKDLVQDYYHDFNHDGSSEKVRFKFQFHNNEIGVVYHDADGRIKDQWNFAEKWLPRAVYFSDYNGDLFDEVYFFTLAHDSLFLYAFDPRHRNQFILYREFIACAPKSNPHPQHLWDISTPEAVFFDANDDGFKECFISLAAGLSLSPRGLFRFDIVQKKITAQTDQSGAFVVKPILVDLDHDGTPEILMKNSTAPDNYHFPVPYKDDNAYLMVFDKNLNFYFPPKVYPEFRSSAISLPYTIGNRTFIFTSYSYHGNLDINSKIYLYNFKGRQLREKMFPKGLILSPFIIIKNNHEQLYLVSSESGEILRPNFNLDIVKTIHLEFPVSSVLHQADLDGDLRKEIIATTQSGFYLIISPDFEHCYKLPLKYEITDIRNFKSKGNFGSELIIQKENHIYRFQYVANPLYFWRFIIFSLAVVIVYLILTGLFLTWQKLSANINVHRNLFQFTSAGLCIINHRFQINYLNGNFEHHLFLSKHIESKKNFYQALEEQPTVIDFITSLIKKRTFQEKEIVVRTDQGSKLILLRGYVLPGLFKIPAGFLIETLLQDQKVSTQKLELWTKTVQRMAHDIKTPLATLQLILQSIRMRLPKSPQVESTNIKKDLETMDQELKRIREMTKHFLRFTNLEKPHIQPVSLKKIFKDVLQKFDFFIADGLEIKLDLDEIHDRLLADPVLLEMCFQVIIENAIDALKGKGAIMISSSLIEQIDENFKQYLEIEIMDNGPGISPEILDKIFDPFFTTKENGTGMGLTLAKKIIEDHDGKIEIASKQGKPTQVRILIPYKEPAEETNA